VFKETSEGRVSRRILPFNYLNGLAKRVRQTVWQQSHSTIRPLCKLRELRAIYLVPFRFESATKFTEMRSHSVDSEPSLARQSALAEVGPVLPVESGDLEQGHSGEQR
jgi:hypothetical protein